jgi:Protein of unknown function (DUF3035)
MTQTNVQTPSTLRATAAVGVLIVALSGCTDVKRSLGYEKAPPDEFQVVQRAPLAMPPEFSLRPPSPGAVRPQEGSTRDQARSTMLGMRRSDPVSTSNRDSGDMALLKRAGAEQIQPGVRELINKETQALAEGNRNLTDKLVFWRKPDGIGAGEQLDATKEAQRLRDNQAMGRAVTEGDSPRIERKRKGMLQGIF